MYDGGSKDWKDGWPTEKYEKYEKKVTGDPSIAY